MAGIGSFPRGTLALFLFSKRCRLASKSTLMLERNWIPVVHPFCAARKSEKSWHCPLCSLESSPQTANSTFSLLTPPSLHFLHELSASSSQLSFQDLDPGKWPPCSRTFPVAAELLLNPSCLHCPMSSPLHQGTLGGEGDTFIHKQLANAEEGTGMGTS